MKGEVEMKMKELFHFEIYLFTLKLFYYRANVTIELDTSTVQGFLFSAQAHSHWPDIFIKRHRPFKFPLTQIGNISVSISRINHLVDNE